MAPDPNGSTGLLDTKQAHTLVENAETSDMRIEAFQESVLKIKGRFRLREGLQLLMVARKSPKLCRQAPVLKPQGFERSQRFDVHGFSQRDGFSLTAPLIVNPLFRGNADTNTRGRLSTVSAACPKREWGRRPKLSRLPRN
jgi:hypothetical protein